MWEYFLIYKNGLSRYFEFKVGWYDVSWGLKVEWDCSLVEISG